MGSHYAMVGEIIAAIIIGIIAGYLGRLLLPGRDPMGFVQTVIFGIIGALVGWVLFTYLLGIGDEDKFDLGGIIGAIIGTMIVLLIWRAIAGRGGERTAARRPV
ncbi:MAG TPA: GlsB/YeaQ/YmgE family stress response membrane protein [Solirubrobacteraceae bacterium]|nr:GlsB/YeaQ/YmgE family stress response membrane protein [Solirubrobacteraceae bacterium]